MSRSLLQNAAGVAAFIFPIVSVLENKYTPLFLIGALAAALLVVRPLRPRLWVPLAAAFAAFLLWALLSAVWSIAPGHSLARFGRLFPTVAAGFVLCAVFASSDFEKRRAAGLAYAAGLLIASAIAVAVPIVQPMLAPGAIDSFARDMPLLSFGAMAVLSIFVMTAMLDTRPIPLLVPLAMLAATAAIVKSGNGTSSLALAIGIAAGVAVFGLGRRAVVALAVALPLAFISSAVVVRTADLPALSKDMGWRLENSTGHRLIIWRYVYGKAQEHPLLGWGLHTARLMPDREEQVTRDPAYADIMAVTRFWEGANIEKMPMHPHNATLQTWLELGAVGTALYAILYGVCLLGLARLGLSRTALGAGAGGAVAVFVIGQLSFSAWQSWWLCAQFLAAAFFLFLVRKSLAPPATG